jgi:diguanylate cyclase (GGDEF)-like protein
MSDVKESTKINNLSVLLAVIVGSVVFALLHTLCKFQKDEYFYKEQQAALDYGDVLTAAVDRELNSLLFVSNGLASYLTVYQNELDPQKVNGILEDLWKRTKNVRNLGIAVGYRLSYIYPVVGNEKIVGLDFRTVAPQYQKVQTAIDLRQGLLDGPINLVQGGTGIVYRYPIFIDNQYWGILSTVINTQPFLKDAFKNKYNEIYDFAIRTEDKNVFYGKAELFTHKKAVFVTSDIPNGKWEWVVEKRDLTRPGYFYVMDVLKILLSLLAAWGVYHYAHERYSLKKEALIDSLTNLPNRRYFDRKLDQAAFDVEQRGEMLCVMIIDLDHFKSINDTHGHSFGDLALITVAKLIQSKIRGSDTLSRVGGDEFVLLLPHLKTAHDAEVIASKILKAVEDPQLIFGSLIKLSLSIGLAITQPGNSLNTRRILKQADEALYEAKGEGRGRYKIFKT